MTAAIILIGIGWFCPQLADILYRGDVIGETYAIALCIVGVVLVLVGACIAIAVSRRDSRELKESLRRMN